MSKPPLANVEPVSNSNVVKAGGFYHLGFPPDETQPNIISTSLNSKDDRPINHKNRGMPSVELFDIVSPVLANAFRSLKGNGFKIFVTDRTGTVVEALPSCQSLPFDNWNEDVIGANAIGTSIKIKKPLQMSGIDHYHEKLRSTTSSAVPIFDTQGEVIAVLAIIGPQEEDHSRVLSMLHKAVKILVYKWQAAQKDRQFNVFNQYLNNIINITMDGIILLSPEGIVEQINPAAVKILGKTEDELCGEYLHIGLDSHLNNMLNKGISFTDIELYINSPNDRIHCLASGKPSRDDKGNITGGVLVLHSMGKVHKPAKNVGPTQAKMRFTDIIGQSPTLLSTLEIARIAANNQSNVLIQGESGTGKEVFAQAIHNESNRRNGPFVAINCGAIPRELIGSELFGYADGAFTGARRGGRMGKFEMASGGTLFLDEIGDMPLEQQVVLLRVLQDKLVTRVGDNKAIPVDVRIICASNRDLLIEVEKGNFRQDLYYRLNVISITIPPLRERREDIIPLFNHYLKKLGVSDRCIHNLMNPDILQYLLNYDWPGNVRELQNLIERLALIADTRPISLDDLPQRMRTLTLGPNSDDSFPDLPESYVEKKNHILAEYEAEQIKMLLKQLNGNLTEVAKAMGFSRTTLYRKIEKYNIKR